MTGRYVEAILVGIITAVVAGCYGIGTSHTAGASTTTQAAIVAPMSTGEVRDSH